MPITFLNGSAQDHADFNKAKEYLMKTPEGQFLFNQAWTKELKINFNNVHNDSLDNYTGIVSWDPKSALQVRQPNGEIGAQSAALGLLHEIYHWYTKYIVGDFDEYLATEFEARAAVELGEPVRKGYYDTYTLNPYVKAYDTTAHADKSGWKSVEYGTLVPGPEYDPNVEVITPGDAGGGGGSGGDSGGGHNPNGPGGSGPTPSDPPPKQPIVIVRPAALREEDASTFINKENQPILTNAYEEPVPIEIIGTPEVYF